MPRTESAAAGAMLEALWFIPIGFLLVGLSSGTVFVVASESAVDSGTFQQALLREFGVALLVAGFLGSSFEFVQRVHLMQETRAAIEKIRGEQIVQTLRTMMSPAVFEEVNDHIIRRPVVRPLHCVTLDLDWMDGQGGQYLRSMSTTQWQMRNLTEAPVAEEIAVFCARYLKTEFPDEYRITKVCFDCGDGLQTREGSTLTVRETAEDMLEYREQLTCRPGQLAEVTAVHRGVHRSHDQLLLLLPQATETFELTVAFPSGLEVGAWANHPCASESFRLVVDQPTLKKWRLAAAALPFQSVQVGWEVTANGHAAREVSA